MGSLLGMYKDAPDVLLSLVKTLVKRPSNDQKTTIKQPDFIGLKSVKNSVKMRVEGHLEGQFGGTAIFLIYLKKTDVWGDILTLRQADRKMHRCVCLSLNVVFCRIGGYIRHLRFSSLRLFKY